MQVAAAVEFQTLAKAVGVHVGEPWSVRSIVENVRRYKRTALQFLYGRAGILIIDEVGKADDHQARHDERGGTSVQGQRIGDGMIDGAASIMRSKQYSRIRTPAHGLCGMVALSRAAVRSLCSAREAHQARQPSRRHSRLRRQPATALPLPP